MACSRFSRDLITWNDIRLCAETHIHYLVGFAARSSVRPGGTSAQALVTPLIRPDCFKNFAAAGWGKFRFLCGKARKLTTGWSLPLLCSMVPEYPPGWRDGSADMYRVSRLIAASADSTAARPHTRDWQPWRLQRVLTGPNSTMMTWTIDS